MAKTNEVYIQNTGDHGIKVHSADGKLTRRFDILRFDNTTGHVTHSGYTPIPKEEYERLLKESKVFSHFMELKWLVKHDELPEEAMSPHDALVSAKQEAAEQEAWAKELEQENEALKKELEALKAKSGKGGGGAAA
jgi:hypothetical protein